MKKGVIITILDLVFLVAFNIIFFIVGGTDRVASVWIAYAFVHVSYLMLLVTPLLTRKSSSAHIFGASIATVSFVYFIVSLIANSIIIYLNSDSSVISISVNVAFTAAYIIMLMVVLHANERTAEAIEKHEQELIFVKTASAKLQMVLEMTNNKETEKKVQAAYDVIHASPVASSPSVSELENEILVLIGVLDQDVSTQQVEQIKLTSEKIIRLANQRNTQLKLEA